MIDRNDFFSFVFIPQIFQNRKRQNQKSRHIQHFKSKTRDSQFEMSYFHFKIGHFISKTVILISKLVILFQNWSFYFGNSNFEIGHFISKWVILFRNRPFYFKNSNFNFEIGHFISKSVNFKMAYFVMESTICIFQLVNLVRSFFNSKTMLFKNMSILFK